MGIYIPSKTEIKIYYLIGFYVNNNKNSIINTIGNIYFINNNPNNIMKDLIIRYSISTVISFTTGVVTYFATMLSTVESFSELSGGALLMGALFAGSRLAVKVIVELLQELKKISN